MAKTKKASKKAGKKAASRNVVKHPGRKHAKAPKLPKIPKIAKLAKIRTMKDRRGRLHVIEESLPSGLIAKPAVAQPKSKHRSYFEFVENTDKKKKLEFTVTNNSVPPPGYEFVPIGNPALTAACKELSREQEAMIFIVSTYGDKHQAPDLGVALNRVGHHVREYIVEQARESLGGISDTAQPARLNVPEPIPEDQEEINKQADAAIRDLFPRIPHTDRQIIIEHSFQKGARGNDGMPLVGLAKELTLSRRVQLAVISHIRHTHTRYDQLLRETTWANARRAVEELCLDILVKWRGDEENGRDQLDEILREVVVISDSEDDDEEEGDDEDEDDDDDDSDDEDTDMTSGESSDESGASTGDRPAIEERRASAPDSRPHAHSAAAAAVARPPPVHQLSEAERVKEAAKRAHRGFQRYQAVRDQAWQQAISRQRQGHDHALSGPGPATISRPESHADRRGQLPGAYYQPYAAEQGHDANWGDHNASHSHQVNPGHHSAARSDIRESRGIRLSPNRGHIGPSQQPMYYYDRGQGFYDGHSGRKADSPVVGSRPKSPPSEELRTIVSRPAPADLKDYLLPSIEPGSPLASRFQAQSLEEGRQGQPYAHWQSRPVEYHADPNPPSPSSQIPDEGFIRVVRKAGHLGRSNPVSLAAAIDPRDNGLGRSDVRGSLLHRPVTVANPGYHPVSTGIEYITPGDNYSRQDQPRFTTAQSSSVAYRAAPESTWRPAAPNDGYGHDVEAHRPTAAYEGRRQAQSYSTAAAPIPDHGGGVRYSDASRPIVVEDEHTWRAPNRPLHAPFRGANELGRATGQQQAECQPGVYRHGPPSTHPYDMVPNDTRRPPEEFIPVSNMFPRPHAPLAIRDETLQYADAPPRLPAPVDGAAGNGYDRRYLPQTRELWEIPTRQERVVRYEYVDEAHTNQGQMQPIRERGVVYGDVQGHPGARPISGTHEVPPRTRPSRQDGVIYIE